MKERQSNMELLRIVAMIAVVGVHLDGASLGLPTPCGDIASVTAKDWWRLIVESLTIIGVNCFTLISGYFGIKASFKGFISYTLQCLWYSVGICTAVLLVRGDWCWNEWGESWMVFTHNDLWYVPAYLGLYLFAPFLNESIKYMTTKKFGITLTAFVAFNLYAGWWWGGGFNPTGYTIVHLVMMYLIGAFINKSGIVSRLKAYRYHLMSAYVLSSIAIAIMAVYCDSRFTFAYNSPLVIISSVAVFCFFNSLNFTNHTINWLASSSFAIYLVHKNPYIWGGYIKKIAIEQWAKLNLVEYTLFYIAFLIAIFMCVFVIDIARRKIWKYMPF